MKKTEQFVRSLIEEPVDLDRLEIEISKLRPKFSTIDPELVVQVQSKYSDGREFQTNCVTIIQSAQENEFTQEGIKVIDQLMKDAKKLNLDFPELRRLETVRLIPKWVAKIHTIIIDGVKNTQKDMKLKKVKPLRILRQEAMKGLDALEPQKLQPDMKEALIEALNKDVPEVLDQELFKLLKKIQLILWIKDAFDLLGKEVISLADLVALKDAPSQEDSQFQHLKFKYLTFHKQITELFNQQENWMQKATQLEGKLSVDETTQIDSSRAEQLRKGFEQLKKVMSPNISKITEVKEKFDHLSALINRIQWGYDCQEYLKNDTERKKLEDLESLYRRADECKVPRSWGMFATIETLYTQVKDLIVKSKKLMGDAPAAQATKMDIEEDASTKGGIIEIIDYEKKNELMKLKITSDELDQSLARMKELNVKVDFDSQIEFLEASKKNQEKYVQTITRCYNAHQNAMENYKDTPHEDLLSIRQQISDIAKLEQTILVAQPKFDAYFMKIHWSIDCAFFLSSSPSIKMKKDLEACGKLVRAAKVIKDIENSKLFLSLNEQLNIYNKCNDAVELLRKDEKKRKPEERQGLITTKNFRELESALRVVTIEDSQLLFKYVQKLKRKMEIVVEEYDEAMRNAEKQPAKFWKELLDRFYTSKIPVKCDEECMLEIMIQTAEDMETQLKALKKNAAAAATAGSPTSKKRNSSSTQNAANSAQTIEILERYRLQQVKLTEAEKLLEKVKLKEDALSVIEKRLYSTSTAGEQLSYAETLKIAQEVLALQAEFKGERMERLKQELFLKKILVLKDLWENKGQTEGTSFEHMKNLESEAKIKFEKRIEPRFAAGLQFLTETVNKCAERVKQIDANTNVKDLEAILKEESDKLNSLRYCGFVDMQKEIVDRIAVLKNSQEQAKKKEQEKKSSQTQAAASQQVVREKEHANAKDKTPKLEEDKKISSKSTTDPRTAKKQEVEDSNRLQERLAISKKSSTQFKQALISDVAKSINAAFASINLQDCLVFATHITERSFIDNSSAAQATAEQIAAICKLFEQLKKHTHVSAMIKKAKFEWTEVLRLLKLSQQTTVRGYKDGLEKEEKMVQVSHTIKQAENSGNLVMNDVKFRKKEDTAAAAANAASANVAITPTGKTAAADSNLSPPHRSKKHSTKLPSFLPQIDLLFGGLSSKKEDPHGSSSFVNIDDNNITKQSVARIREGKLSMAKLGLLNPSSSSNRKQRFGGARFSDDEDDEKGGSEYVPLREEDFKTLNESLSLSAQKRKLEHMGQFNPDAEAVSQKNDEAPDSAQIVSLLQGALQICVDSNDSSVEPQMISINKVYVLSAEDVKECMMMPQCPQQKTCMVVKGVLSLNNFTQYHASLASEKLLNPERKIRVLGGWFETELSQEHQELQTYASYLKLRNRVAVIEWTPECKLYAMHRDQWNNTGNLNQTIKFKRNFFHNSSTPNDTLIFLMIFKQYKLYPDQNAYYENVRPIFMQKRHSTADSASSSSSKLSAAATMLLQQSHTNPSTMKMSIAADGKQSITGKKSFGKMSALQALTFDSDSDDADEERRLNERVLAIKNQFARFDNNMGTTTATRPTPNNDRFARLSSQQSQSMQGVSSSSSSRYNNQHKSQQQFSRTSNRSGITTPNYYEQQQQQLSTATSFGQDQINDAIARHFTSTSKASVNPRSMSFDAMELEPDQSYPSSSSYSRNGSNSMSQFNQLQQQIQQQQQQSGSFFNSQQPHSQRELGKGFKRTHHHLSSKYQSKSSQLQQMQTSDEEVSLGQDPTRIGSILSTLDQTLRELIKSQKTKEQTPSEYLINTLLHQQQQTALQQQQKLIQQLQKQSSVNAEAAAAAAAAAALDKKKKTRKRKKRPSTERTTNQSADGNSSMSEDDSQDSYHQSASVQKSVTPVALPYQQQLAHNSLRSNNNNNNNSSSNSGGMQYSNNFAKQSSSQSQLTQASLNALNRNTPYLNALNNKKQLKYYDKQVQKIDQQTPQQQSQSRTSSSSNHHHHHHASSTYSSHFARNSNNQADQHLPSDNNNNNHNNSNNNNSHQLLTEASTSGSTRHHHHQQHQQQQHKSRGTTSSSSSSSNNSNHPTIQFTTNGPQSGLPAINLQEANLAAATAAVTMQQQQQQLQQQQQSSLTALNSLHNLMKLNPNHNSSLTATAASSITAAPTQASISSNQASTPLGRVPSSHQGLRVVENHHNALSHSSSSSNNSNNHTTSHSSRHSTDNLYSNIPSMSNNSLRSRQPDYTQDLETTQSQQLLQHQARPLLTDLSKSGRINQERISNSFLTLRGETKETNSNPSEIPRYMKEKSVRNPTFYQTRPGSDSITTGNTTTTNNNNSISSSSNNNSSTLQTNLLSAQLHGTTSTKQHHNSSGASLLHQQQLLQSQQAAATLLKQKSNFSYSSVNSREAMLLEQQFDKENGNSKHYHHGSHHHKH